jgi:hypothetical protein
MLRSIEFRHQGNQPGTRPIRTMIAYIEGIRIVAVSSFSDGYARSGEVAHVLSEDIKVRRITINDSESPYIAARRLVA